MRWHTYAPDGRALEIIYENDAWVATCNNRRGEAATAAEALKGALEEGVSPIGRTAHELTAWIEEQAGRLERESEA